MNVLPRGTEICYIWLNKGPKILSYISLGNTGKLKTRERSAYNYYDLVKIPSDSKMRLCITMSTTPPTRIHTAYTHIPPPPPHPFFYTWTIVFCSINIKLRSCKFLCQEAGLPIRGRSLSVSFCCKETFARLYYGLVLRSPRGFLWGVNGDSPLPNQDQ